MNAVNKPTQTALQTFMVQTRAVHQPLHWRGILSSRDQSQFERM